MRISIDTKEDSAEDIKKVVRMLQAWLEGHTNAPSNMFSDDSSPSMGLQDGVFNMFNDSSAADSGSKDTKKDDDDDLPRVITY